MALDPINLSVDVLELERTSAEDTLAALERAAALYGGELLAGLMVKDPAFESWLAGERERLHELGLRVLGALLARQTAAALPERAIETALRLLALDPLQETVHRALMRLYAAQGRGAAALRRYQVCVEALWRELRVEPEPETKRLYQEILAQRSSQAPATAGAPRASEPAAPRGGDASARLPLIGRTAELAQVRAALRLTGEGRTRVVAVLGEAGIGKTRFVEEITADAVGEGCRLIQGRAHPSEQILPFGLWVTALRESHALEDAEALKVAGPGLAPGARPPVPRAGTGAPARRGAASTTISASSRQSASCWTRSPASSACGWCWRTRTGPTRRASGSWPSLPGAFAALPSPSCSRPASRKSISPPSRAPSSPSSEASRGSSTWRSRPWRARRRSSWCGRSRAAGAPAPTRISRSGYGARARATRSSWSRRCGRSTSADRPRHRVRFRSRRASDASWGSASTG